MVGKARVNAPRKSVYPWVMAGLSLSVLVLAAFWTTRAAAQENLDLKTLWESLTYFSVIVATLTGWLRRRLYIDAWFSDDGPAGAQAKDITLTLLSFLVAFLVYQFANRSDLLSEGASAVTYTAFGGILASGGYALFKQANGDTAGASKAAGR